MYSIQCTRFFKREINMSKLANMYYLTYNTSEYIRNVDDNTYIIVTLSCTGLSDVYNMSDFIKNSTIFYTYDSDINKNKYCGFVMKKNLDILKKQCVENNILLKYDNIVSVERKLENDMLFAYRNNRCYRTKMTGNDLPKSYCRIQYPIKNGYIRTDGVTHIVYKPSIVTDESTKDDMLFIFYDDNDKYERGGDNLSLYDSCDEFVFGRDINLVIDYIEKYSEINISEIKKRIDKRMQDTRSVFNERFNIHKMEASDNG